jgi:hypothetical protein
MSIKNHLGNIIPLLLIPLILVMIWFRKGLILGGGDESFIFYNPQISLGILNSTWQEYQTGFPFLVWLSRANFVFLISILQNKLFLPNFLLQAATFYILMVTGVVSVYFLTKSFLKDNKNSYLISLVSAIFYLFNPFSVSQVWGRGQIAQYFSFALLPLSLLLFALGLERKKLIFVIYLSLATFLLSAAFGFVTFIVVLWVVLLFYLVYWILRSNQKKKDLVFGITFLITTFVLWCFVSAWWLLPFITSGSAVLSGYLENSAENIGTLLGVSKNFTPDIIIRLLQRTYYYDASAFSPIYKSFFFQLISFIPLFFVVIGSFKIFKDANLVGFKYLLILLITGLVVSLGANPPFGWFFVWLFENVSLLQSFRNPFEKFGLVYALGYSAVFAFGLISFLIKTKYKNFLAFIFLVLTCGVFAWPMWSGKVVSFPNDVPGIDIPKYYTDLNNWLNINNGDDYRVLMTPIWSGDGTIYRWNNTKYNGIDPMMFLLDTTVISSNPSIPYFHEFIQNIRKYMERIDVVPALGLLRTKYLVNRDDAVIEDKEKAHKVFLTEAIFPPDTSSGDNVCENLYSNSKAHGMARVICRVPIHKNDWSKPRYLHVTIKTEVAAYVELALTDQNLIRIRWDGRSPLASEYKTVGSDWTTITFPLSAPTEYNRNMDFSKVLGIEVLAYSLDFPKVGVNEISVKQITLDSGLKEKTNVFSLIRRFGDLQIYQPSSFNLAEEFGTLEEVNQVEDFVHLFRRIKQEADLINRKGYILITQNPSEKLNNFRQSSFLTTQDKYKFSDTRYWLKVKDRENGWLLLSKTYNPEWKVIKGAGKEMLEGGMLNNLRLFGMQVLPEQDHLVVNGYANLWKTDGQNDQYAIVFMPQVVADIGWKVSISSIMLLVGVTVLWQVKKYISSH